MRASTASDFRIERPDWCALIRTVVMLVLVAAGFSGNCCRAQEAPEADRPLRLAVFFGPTGTYTNFNGGQNVAITGGADLGVGMFYGFRPALEVRATYPVYDGHLNTLEDVLGGVRLGRYLPRFNLHPYVDGLYGSGQINYVPSGGGFYNPAGTVFYKSNSSTFLSLGGGGDYDLSPRFAFKADMQSQRYTIPVTTSGRRNAIVTTFAIVYRFGYGGSSTPQ